MCIRDSVNPARQREGIGSKATYLLCKYGFDVLQLHKIYLYTNATNQGARKTYEKIGFTLEGTHRSEMVCNEVYEDRLYYGLLSNELDKDCFPLDFSGWNGIILDKRVIAGRDITLVRDDSYPNGGGGKSA